MPQRAHPGKTGAARACGGGGARVGRAGFAGAAAEGEQGGQQEGGKLHGAGAPGVARVPWDTHGVPLRDGQSPGSMLITSGYLLIAVCIGTCITGGVHAKIIYRFIRMEQ